MRISAKVSPTVFSEVRTDEGRVDPVHFPSLEGFVGREEELAVLRAALEQARAGRAQVVLIEGEPGTGKSALLEAFLRGYDTGKILRLRCDEFEADLALAAVGVLLDLPISVFSEVEAGRRLLSRLSDAQSRTRDVTVLAIDDAQWLDRPSAHALRFALRRLGDDRILTVIARRPPPAHGDDGGPADVATAVVRPAALDADSVRQLAWQLRSWDLSRAMASRLVQRTGGIPLLLVAVLRGARDPMQLDSRAEVPSTVAAAATRLLSSVPRPTQLLVEASAVLAEPIDLMALGRLADVEDPFDAVGPADAVGLVQLGPDAVVDCAHDLLREAVYSAIPLGRQRELHARAAEWTTGDRRLAHRAAAADRPDPDLVGELMRAADAARMGLHYDLAASQRLRARSVSADPGQRDGLLLEALIDRVSSQDLSGATQLAAAAQRLSPSPLRSLALGLLARESGRIGEARTHLSDAMARARASGDRIMHERAGVATGILLVRINEGRAAVEVVGDADRAADPEVAGDARTTKGIGLWQAGDPEGALALLNDARMSPDGTAWETDLLAVRGAIRMYTGQLPQALTDFDRAVALVHLWRPSANQSRIYMMRSSVRFVLGDWDGAAVDAAAARALAEGRAEAWSVSTAQAVSADVPIGRGQWSVAGEHLRVAKAALARLDTIQGAEIVDARAAALLLARQDYAAVLRLLMPLRGEEHLARLAAFRPYRWVMPAWIIACTGLGRLADAERSISDYEVMIERWPGGPGPSRLGWLRGVVAEARGEPRAARGHYVTYLQEPELQQSPFVHAEVLYNAGRLEHALDNRRCAVEHLRRAQSIFAGLRAQPHVERCVAELNACGLRSTISSPLALTGREEDVAALVTRGYTNKEVGAELFLTAKAVEYHLSKIYAKLGVSNRRELRRKRDLQ